MPPLLMPEHVVLISISRGGREGGTKARRWSGPAVLSMRERERERSSPSFFAASIHPSESEGETVRPTDRTMLPGLPSTIPPLASPPLPPPRHRRLNGQGRNEGKTEEERRAFRVAGILDGQTERLDGWLDGGGEEFARARNVATGLRCPRVPRCLLSSEHSAGLH